jgi:hypothetical protein
MKILSATGCMVFAGIFACQASIITFDFTGSAPGNNSPWDTGTTIDPNVTTSGFELGAGVSGHTGDNRFNASSWSAGSTLDSATAGDDYFGFVLTPISGYALNLDSVKITFTLQISSTGPHDYAFMSSLGGFDSGDELQDGYFLSGAQTNSFTYVFPTSGFDDISGPIEFRIYGYDDGGSSGTMSVNALSLDGMVVAVPESAETGIISATGLLVILGLDIWRRRAVMRHP